MGGESWKSIAVSDWFLALKEGMLHHVLASPFEVYGNPMEINREQTQGRTKIPFGATGKREAYSTLNVTTITAEGIVVELSICHDLQEMVRIQGEIPDPAFGYLRGILIGHQKLDYVSANDLVGRDSNKLVYVGNLGRNGGEISFMCEMRDCACRYHMGYTRGYGGEWTIGRH